MLSKEEKSQIINSRLRSLAYTKYGFEIDEMQENAKTSPSSELLASLASQKGVVDLQIAALEEELSKVNAAIE